MRKRIITGDCDKEPDWCTPARHVLYNSQRRETLYLSTKYALKYIALGWELVASEPGHRKDLEDALETPLTSKGSDTEVETDNELNELLPKEGDDYKAIQGKIDALNKIRSSIDEVHGKLNTAMCDEMSSLAELLKKYGEKSGGIKE